MSSDDRPQPNTAEMAIVQNRILDIQTRRRARIRWHITRHTAELAIAALSRSAPYRKSSKSRRRKRSKRLL